MIAATLIAIPENVGSVQTGPFVDVTVSNTKLEVGKETTVTVFVYELEGEDQVPKDLIEVRMTTSMGSFESVTGITNQNGYCTFTYHAPDDIDGPTDVQINATAEIGALNYIGRAEILVSYKLVGRIEGPSMLKKGSPVTTYIVNVTANGEPMENVNIMPTVYGSGSMDSYSKHTGPDGKGSLRIIPSDDSTGKITIMIQLGLMDYLGVAVSRFIQVVEELAPLNVTVSADHNPLRWGSCHLIAKVSRGDYPESGVTIHWDVSSGYVLRERTTTNESGESRVILTTLPDGGMNWPDHIVVNVTASQLEIYSYAEENISIEEEELSIDILDNSEFRYRVKHSQLYPGEDLVLDLNLFHRLYQSHDWEWVWGMRLDLILYYGEEVIFQSTLESGLHTLEETIVEVDKRAVWTVPDDITDGNYTWSLLLTDRDNDYEYWSYQADKPLLLRRQGRDDWTIMYFFAGRNNLAPWFDRSLKDLKKNAPDGEYKVLCNYDRSNQYDDPYYVKWDGTKYFDLEEGYSKEDTMFGPNSGDPDNLVSFMEWATAISTTGNYCLVYCDHGAAHRGIGVDEYWNDHLTIGEFENGLGSFSGIRRDLEVLVMDACHMASLEVANYLSEYTRYQVFSQLTIYSDHSFDNEKALKNLNQYDWESYKPSSLQVATDYLNSFIQVAGGTEYDSPAMVLDSEKGYRLAHLFNEAMRAVYLGWDTLGECFDVVFEEAQRLEGPFSDQWNLTDMKNMLILLREELSDYVLDPDGRAAFNKVGEVIYYFDSARAY